MLEQVAPVQLIEQARSGDTAAFGKLVQKYGVAVRTMCLLRTPDPERADDISQQVFVTAWKKLKDLGPNAKWWPWLEAIAKNQLRNEWRRVKREKRFKQQFTLAWLAEKDADETGLEHPGQLSSHLDSLKRCIEELPPHLQNLVKLRYEDGSSSGRIGQVLGRKAEAIRQLLVRLRGKLRGCVEQRLAKTRERRA